MLKKQTLKPWPGLFGLPCLVAKKIKEIGSHRSKLGAGEFILGEEPRPDQESEIH